MSDNNSTVSGFLTPISPPVPYDDDLLDLLQPIIVGIGGWPDSSLVRPRWQTADVPNQPDYSVNWCAFGIARTRTDTFQYEGHVDQGLGYDYLERMEELDLLISCYGPTSKGYSELMRDGFGLEQNRAYLNALKMELLFVGDAVTLPALLHSVWVRRVDMTITLRRIVERQYSVQTIQSPPSSSATPGQAQLGLNNELYLTPLSS